MIFVNIYRKHLVELIMAIMVTPTSANTAVHILAMPNVPSTITNIFIPNAKTIFCHNILLVFFDTFIASTKAFISSFINTISAAYPIIIIDLSLDPKDVILERIYGKEPMKLSAKLIGRGMQDIPVDNIELELMYIQGSDAMPQKSTMSDPDEISQRVGMSFMTVCRQPYKTMTTLANEIIENKDIVKFMVMNY